jgi:predicted TIM-barrel fold metal-dependent hydrolase
MLVNFATTMSRMPTLFAELIFNEVFERFPALTIVGVDTMLWCSDFPHHITDWPHSRYLINSMSQGIDAAKKRKLFCENAGKLYGFIE